MNTKHLIPAVLALGMAAGSTAAYAQTLNTDTDLGTSVEAGECRSSAISVSFISWRAQ